MENVALHRPGSMHEIDISDFVLRTRPIAELHSERGVTIPAGVSYRQLLITGPPGAGKSTMIRTLRGWPDEGYIDLSLNNWWKSRALSLRPREIHLGFPCQGFRDALAVFDEQWVTSLSAPELDLSRVRIPPKKRRFYNVDWHKRYVFEFLIPTPAALFEQRRKRQEEYGTHHVDEGVSLERVKNQLLIYQVAAYHLCHSGLTTYIREGTESDPLEIVLSESGYDGAAAGTSQDT
jgi:adenylate kinase family enzyme